MHSTLKRLDRKVQCYSLSQNGWDTLGFSCPLDVGLQDLVTEP